ncbi:MAG: adenosylhomocysteinase [Thermodesulfobacteriota bacterium]|nr:adenosylhomocysteinase [Thermodesulfobacteriota bacterium]
MEYDVKDLSLSHVGKGRVEWAAKDMPVLKSIMDRFSKEKPLAGFVIGACLHVTTETAMLAITLKQAGANVFLCASNPLSTQDDVAAYLVSEHEIPVFAIKGEDNDTYYKHIESVLKGTPNITMDDGADLVSSLHTKRKDLIEGVIGGSEETTTGVIRLEAMAKDGALAYPIIAVNNAKTKFLFDNRYGTGQSSIDGIIRATNRLIAGTNFVVSGYGWCGKGLARRAQGMGANVIITEINPLAALEAVMDGFRVMPMEEAARIGDFFCTVSGDCSVLRKEHFLSMKDGAIIANSGHFNVEIDIEDLKDISKSTREIRPFVEEYTLKDGKNIYLLAQGRLVNLGAAEGHPSAVMDMSFANQALSAEYLRYNSDKLRPDVYSVPEDIDKDIARLKLGSMGIKIDTLTKEQKKYLSSWDMGT